ncbi:MAG: TerC family protein [Hyphomicrobiaceae bacterium]
MLAMLSQVGDQIIIWYDLLVAQYGPLGVQVLKIIWINILLSGDNAVVIALACRSLPAHQRKWGIIFGAGAAVLLRVIFTVGMQYVLGIPLLKLVGGLLLLWISVKLLTGEEADEDSVKDSDNLWGAVRTVAIADLVMSLDNVLAIAAAAKNNTGLIIFGLAVSIPLIVAGATLILGLLTRFPALVWAGAALLGWVSGELIVEEPLTIAYFDHFAHMIGLSHHGIEYVVSGFCAGLVMAIGWYLRRREHASSAA